MSKIEEYQHTLRHLPEWESYLLENSGLPGPRGNIELAHAVAREGSRQVFTSYLTYTSDIAPVNSPYEFLAFCGTLGLGYLLAGGDTSLLPQLINLASDPRWRVREAVAMALQQLGDVDMPLLLGEMRSWASGSPFVQRAAAAALCEPRLLCKPQYARETLQILDSITTSIEKTPDRKSDGFKALRKGMGYCWSVAVVALPSEGKACMEKWLEHPDPDIRWIMQENLKKSRLFRMDQIWVKRWMGKEVSYN